MTNSAHADCLCLNIKSACLSQRVDQAPIFPTVPFQPVISALAAQAIPYIWVRSVSYYWRHVYIMHTPQWTVWLILTVQSVCLWYRYVSPYMMNWSAIDGIFFFCWKIRLNQTRAQSTNEQNQTIGASTCESFTLLLQRSVHSKSSLQNSYNMSKSYPTLGCSILTRKS